MDVKKYYSYVAHTFELNDFVYGFETVYNDDFKT